MFKPGYIDKASFMMLNMNWSVVENFKEYEIGELRRIFFDRDIDVFYYEHMPYHSLSVISNSTNYYLATITKLEDEYFIIHYLCKDICFVADRLDNLLSNLMDNLTHV